MPILIKRKGRLDESTRNEIMAFRTEIVNDLLEFMSYCYTTQTGSKYSLMGPAGKILNLLNTTKPPDWEEIKGYITNVVRMSQKWINPIGLDILDRTVNNFRSVREKLTEMEWLDFISGVDYELFFQLFKTGTDRAAENIRKTFQEFLEKKFSDIEATNTALGTNCQKWSEFDLNIVSTEIPEAKIVISEFWEEYKKQKKKQKSKDDVQE